MSTISRLETRARTLAAAHLAGFTKYSGQTVGDEAATVLDYRGGATVDVGGRTSRE